MVLQPLGTPLVEVIATAKRNLVIGETIDGLSGYMSYGQCERADVTANARLLPMGVTEGCGMQWPRIRTKAVSTITQPACSSTMPKPLPTVNACTGMPRNCSQ